MANATTKTTRDRKATHELLDSAGNVVEKEEEATGIRYSQIGGSSFDYQTGGEVGEPITMLACFGAKTLATNVASGVRNDPKGAGSQQDEMDEIRARFDLIETGVWADRTREGGFKIDLATLAQAGCEIMNPARVKAGKAEVAPAELHAKIEADPSLKDKVWATVGVQDAYRRLRGRAQVSVDDLSAALD